MAGSAGFPQCGELHQDVVAFVAQAVKADPATLEAYDWAGQSGIRHGECAGGLANGRRRRCAGWG